MEALLTAPVFAAETSPLGATSVSKLASLATTAGVAVINEHAALIFVGTRLGLVVIRGLDAVSGAVWDGARPEIVEFSGDVTASLLMALRHRLGVRTQTGTKKTKMRTPGPGEAGQRGQLRRGFKQTAGSITTQHLLPQAPIHRMQQHLHQTLDPGLTVWIGSRLARSTGLEPRRCHSIAPMSDARKPRRPPADVGGRAVPDR